MVYKCWCSYKTSQAWNGLLRTICWMGGVFIVLGMFCLVLIVSKPWQVGPDRKFVHLTLWDRGAYEGEAVLTDLDRHRILTLASLSFSSPNPSWGGRRWTRNPSGGSGLRRRSIPRASGVEWGSPAWSSPWIQRNGRVWRWRRVRASDQTCELRGECYSPLDCMLLGMDRLGRVVVNVDA